MDVTEMEIKECKANYLTIRYEDFVTNPTGTIYQILDFAELGRSSLVDKYLQKIKIFNQNKKNEETVSSIYKNEHEIKDLKRILEGQYAY